MYRKIRTCLTVGAAAALMALTACSEDDNNPKYISLPPEFTGVEVAPLSADSDRTIRAGEPFTVTAVQGKKGRLLYGATYAWSATPSDGVSHRYREKVIYDQENEDPSDTLIIDRPGTYDIRLNAKYNISGNWIITSGSNEWEGGSATYSTPSTLLYAVELKHKIRVQ